MSAVTEQYDAYPYPERDPRDEAKRLITGSPSHPHEIDHYLFRGVRDWSKPFRALVAGGGTGDALIQMAQVLTSAGRPYDITYLDLSRAAREVAEARARTRGLKGITFHTGSLLDAGRYGPFDYIDCCGVLHHLPDPQAGFDALAGALAEGGGLGLMVYAPHGRAGVYALQDAFGALLTGPPEDRLARAQEIFTRIPEGHPLKRNPHLRDHEASAAGFYDLLLHSQDRPYRIGELLDTLDAAGLAMTASPQAWLYDPAPIVGDAALLQGLDARARMALAEDLRGTIRTHVLYAAKDATDRVATPQSGAVPHLKGVAAAKLAQAAAVKGEIRITHDGQKIALPIAPEAARALRFMDGRHTLQQAAQAAKLDWLRFAPVWRGVSDALSAHGILRYSKLGR